MSEHSNIHREPHPLLTKGESLRIEGAERPPSGGGEKFAPQSLDEALEKLTPQVEQVLDQIKQLPDNYRAPNHLYIEARVLPNYLAVSYFPSDLFSEIGAVPVGSRSDTGTYRTRKKLKEEPTRRIVLAIPDEGINQLHHLMSTAPYTRSKKNALEQIVEFDQIALPTINQVLKVPTDPPEDTLITWEAVLHPAGSSFEHPHPADEATLQRWYGLIEEHDGTVLKDYIRKVGGLTFTPIRLPSSKAGQIESLAKFNPLRVVRPMPKLRSRPTDQGEPTAAPTLSATNQQSYSDFHVAIFDGGVPDGSKVRPDTSTDLTTCPADPDELAHGTGVTGAVLYGMVEPGRKNQRLPLTVDSYRVLPAPNDDLESYWILDQIINEVEKSEPRIVNLSLGPNESVSDDDEPNRWTSELDRIAWDKDVLFIVAAGNSGATNSPRIQPPADMANGLSVGACDRPSPESGWARADYSSTGPGRYGARVQPLGVQFGGSDSRLFQILDDKGFTREGMGTSFAAPVTTHALAEAATHLPRVNVSVLRTLAVHFAEAHRNHAKLCDELGYGRHPLTYDQILNCPGNEVTTLYVDTITRGDYLAYQLPIPDTFSEKVKIHVTLSYVTPVDPTETTEYTRAALNVTLRPHDQIHSFTPPRGSGLSPRSLNTSTNEAVELIKTGWIPSQEPVTYNFNLRGRAEPEGKLRQSGKWETVRTFTTKSFSSSDLHLPRLDVSYIARRGGQRDDSRTTIPFAILVTLIGDDQNIYDRVRNQFSQLLPATQRTRGRIHSRGFIASQTRWY